MFYTINTGVLTSICALLSLVTVRGLTTPYLPLEPLANADIVPRT